jgi:hypothetical protein
MEELAIQTIALLAPYLAMGAEEISKTVAKDVWGKVKDIFKSKNKEELLEKFTASPNEQKLQGQVEYVLQEELENNPKVVEELNNMVRELKASTKYKSEINQKGNDNIAIGGQINNSSISINKDK